MKFVDVHSHILQNLDDGPRNIETAIDILKESANQNVETIVLTPHFYSSKKQTVDSFIKKRAESFMKLKEEVEKNSFHAPALRLGAEVALDCDLSKVEHIEKLAIEGTNYILIEMPYEDWQDWMFDSIYSLIAAKNLIPIIAHIERYTMKKNEYITKLSNMEVYFQINASSLLDNLYKKATIKLINSSLIHFIGSDVHNMTDRPTKIKAAMDFLENKVSASFVNYLLNNANSLLANNYIEKSYNYSIERPKISIFKRLFGK